MVIGASIGERLAHLINRKGFSDSDLAKVLHINRSTLSRIINGGTEKVSAQLIVDAAQHFGVSTDFLLGLTDMPDPMNHPVESFGLTEAAAKAILSEDVHIEMLNRLLENQRFCQLTHTMHYALEPDQTAGAMTSNNILAYGESLFLECMTPSLKAKKEMKKDSRRIVAEIIDPNTVGNQRMLEEFRMIIQQIRKELKMKKPQVHLFCKVNNLMFAAMDITGIVDHKIIPLFLYFSKCQKHPDTKKNRTQNRFLTDLCVLFRCFAFRFLYGF